MGYPEYGMNTAQIFNLVWTEISLTPIDYGYSAHPAISDQFIFNPSINPLTAQLMQDIDALW